VLNKPVYSVVAGSGAAKVFIWSQMHGNESTTTKAVFDFLNFLKSDDAFAVNLKGYFTFYILPVVNPDGATLYTRENANKVDLNRDALNLLQPESRILRKAFESFKPDYCYNMHDQRTIFGVMDGGIPRPATVSFLSPSYNESCDVNEVREKAMAVISAMNDTLQQYIPGQVGRFDDSFNNNCIGDTFSSLGVPTLLFEAGHYPQDYEREVTRKFIFFALLSGFNAIYENVIVVKKKQEYFNIPENRIIFFDMICKNVKINYENKEIITNFASQYKEVLFENSVNFQALISEIGKLDSFHGHAEYDASGAEFLSEDGDKTPVTGSIANFSLGGRRFENGREITGQP
ncbi:MAG TPA: M14 metallopeptidase family protein, partial [Flavobacterium sp.]|nr:M14 metallopeptidase family protein [Flavobacterium sp.]